MARKLVAAHWQGASATAAVTIVPTGFEPALAARVIEAIVAALLAKSQLLPSYKSGKQSDRVLTNIEIFGAPAVLDITRTVAEAEGNHLARSLTVSTTNELTTARYRHRIAALAKEQCWRLEFLDMKALRLRKSGAFVAVAQGSAAQDDCIVQL